MVNLTEMAKSFPKKNLSQIINSTEIQNYISALGSLQGYCYDELLMVKKGGNGTQGTWGNQKVALRVSQKLSPVFAVWVDTHIEKLIKTGKTALKQNSTLDLLKLAVSEIEKKDKEIALLEPKAELMDKILDSEEKIDIGQASKILELPFGRNTMFRKLRERGIFFKNRNEPKQEYINRKYFVLKEKYIDRNSHSGFVVVKVLVTQKGLRFLSNVFGTEISKKQLALIQ